MNISKQFGLIIGVLFIGVLSAAGGYYLGRGVGYDGGYTKGVDDGRTKALAEFKEVQGALAKKATEDAAKAANPFTSATNPLEGVADPLQKVKQVLNPF